MEVGEERAERGRTGSIGCRQNGLGFEAREDGRQREAEKRETAHV